MDVLWENAMIKPSHSLENRLLPVSLQISFSPFMLTWPFLPTMM